VPVVREGVEVVPSLDPSRARYALAEGPPPAFGRRGCDDHPALVLPVDRLEALQGLSRRGVTAVGEPWEHPEGPPAWILRPIWARDSGVGRMALPP
jgi:hypothetical protein